MNHDKQSIRDYARAARTAIAPEQRTVHAGAAAGRLTTLPEALAARLVLAYIAMPEELDPAPAVQSLTARGVTVAYPRVAGPGALTLHLVRTDADLETARFGLLQPTIASPPVDPADVDLVIVPGLAFDALGGRVGFGGGYYDRLLARMPHALRVGYSYDEQLVGHVPHEPHDTHMDVVVTPSRIVRSPGREHTGL